MSDTDSSGLGGFAAGIGTGLAHKALEPVVRAIRGEVDAARKEIADRIAGARVGVIVIVVGALFALLSLGLLGALIVVLLALSLPLWGAVAITLGGSIVIAVVLCLIGLRLVRRGVPPVPKDTIADVRERLVHKAE